MVHFQGGERSPVESQGISSCTRDIQNICDFGKRVNHEVTHLMMTLKLFRVELIKANYVEFQMSDIDWLKVKWQAKIDVVKAVYMGEA